MNAVNLMFSLTMTAILRDRILHAVLAVGIFLFALIPSFSMFSMRQVQELSVVLSLSLISFLLLVLSSILGSFSVWRDVEKRYTTSALGLPIPRAHFILGKFLGIASFILICAVMLGFASYIVISLSAGQYRSDIPVNWANVVVAIVADGMKYVVLAGFSLLFSTISTSFSFPFFATIAVYFAGTGSQEVYEYVSGSYGGGLTQASRLLIKGLYFIIPNFSAFDFKVQAIYSLTIPLQSITFMVLYFGVYTGILLVASIWIFSKRELP